MAVEIAIINRNSPKVWNRHIRDSFQNSRTFNVFGVSVAIKAHAAHSDLNHKNTMLAAPSKNTL